MTPDDYDHQRMQVHFLESVLTWLVAALFLLAIFGLGSEWLIALAVMIAGVLLNPICRCLRWRGRGFSRDRSMDVRNLHAVVIGLDPRDSRSGSVQRTRRQTRFHQLLCLQSEHI